MSRRELFIKPDPPRVSWWLSQQTREDFMRAHKKELARLKRAGTQTGGEARIVGTWHGQP